MAAEFWQHQKEIIDKLSKLPHSALLHCGMGTGKTRVAIHAIQGNTLIICPKTVMGVWKAQLDLYLDRPAETIILDNKSIVQRAERADLTIKVARTRNIPAIVVCNYEAFWRFPLNNFIIKTKWHTVIYDEAHNLKTPGGKASRFAHRLLRFIPRRIALTGTPMPHSPCDIYAVYRAIDDKIFGTSYTKFKADYTITGGFNGHQVIGFKNQDQMLEKIDKIRIYVPRSVLKLPEKHHIQINFNLEKSKKIYQHMHKNLYAQIQSGECTASNALVRLLRLQQITSGFVKTDDNVETQVGEEKIEQLQTIIDGIDTPVVIFVRFKFDIALIRSKYSVLELSGDVNELKDWPEKSPILVAQIQTAKEGIDLTAAHYFVYYSIGFSLGDYEQSICRGHRPGQRHTVTNYHLIASNTIDDYIYKAIQHKKDIVASIIEELGKCHMS